MNMETIVKSLQNYVDQIRFQLKNENIPIEMKKQFTQVVELITSTLDVIDEAYGTTLIGQTIQSFRNQSLAVQILR